MLKLEQCCVVAFISIFALAQAQDLPAGKATDKQVAVSVRRLMDFVQQPKRDKLADAMAMKLIKRFGLASRPASDDIARIRGAPVPAELIAAIESAHVPELENAALSITCAPVDCEVSINDRVEGRTKGGAFPWLSLQPGLVRITVASPQYETPQERVEVLLASGERRRVHFSFRPSQNYQREIGTRLFSNMVEALRKSGLSGVRTITAAGTLYARDATGAVDGWSVTVSIGDRGVERVVAHRMKETHTLVRSQDGTWKAPAGNRAPHLLDAVKLLDGAMLTRRVEALTRADNSFIACQTDTSAACFQATVPENEYMVTLDALYRPTQVYERNPGGNAPHLTYVYGAYAEDAGLLWPTVIQVIRGNPDTGIEVRFSRIQPVSAPAQPAGQRR
jgi:hypothetical protein